MSSMSLNDLTDVTILGPSIDQRLVYDGSKWVNYFAKVMLTYDDFFKGKTITITKGQSSSTITLPSDATDYIFYVNSAGTYTLSYTYSGYSYTASVTVENVGEMYYTTLLSQDTITVTLYSATGDTLTYTDADGVQKTAVFDSNSSSKEVELTIIPSGIPITFTSSIADDISNWQPTYDYYGRLLGGYYSKTVTVDSSTTEIKVMPDGALWWYGYQSINWEDCTTSNGWSLVGTSSGYSLGVPDHSHANYVGLYHQSSVPDRDYTKMLGYSTSNKTNGHSKIICIYKHLGSLRLINAKEVGSASASSVLQTKGLSLINDYMVRADVDLTEGLEDYYICIYSNIQSDISLYALIVE